MLCVIVFNPTKLKAILLLILIAPLIACGFSLSQVLSGPSTPAVDLEGGSTLPPLAAFEPAPTEAGPPLAARVNAQPILLETYERQLSQVKQTLTNQGIDPNSPAGQEQLAQVQQQILEALIDQTIIEQEASKLGLSISEETVEAKVQESVAQRQDPAQFETWLAENQLSYEEFKATLRFQLLANQMFEQVTRDIPASAEQIQLRQILVADEPTARELIEQLKIGVNFAELAQTHSLDASSRANGGDLGWFSPGLGLVPPEVETIAFSLQPGEVSGPIQSSLGLHIIQLQAKETRPLSPEMIQALKQQRFTEWLSERRALSDIERFVTS